jgi:hypothetical protein
MMSELQDGRAIAGISETARNGQVQSEVEPLAQVGSKDEYASMVADFT